MNNFVIGTALNKNLAGKLLDVSMFDTVPTRYELVNGDWDELYETLARNYNEDERHEINGFGAGDFKYGVMQTFRDHCEVAEGYDVTTFIVKERTGLFEDVLSIIAEIDYLNAFRDTCKENSLGLKLFARKKEPHEKGYYDLPPNFIYIATALLLTLPFTTEEKMRGKSFSIMEKIGSIQTTAVATKVDDGPWLNQFDEVYTGEQDE